MTVNEVVAPATSPSPEPPAGGEVARGARPEPTFLQVFTLVLWVTCLVIGLLGLWLQGGLTPAKPPPPKTVEPPPVQAELIEVAMTTERLIPAATDSPPPPPAAPAEAPPPEAPPLPAVAAPSPAIAFAVPVEGPVRIVPAAIAPAAAPRAVAPAPRETVEHLVYGIGTTAAQPQPDYPDDAKFAHQEGVVGIQFTVAPGGRVNDARIVVPSPFPLLNQSALSTVRDQWADPRWKPGTIYLISIRFKLNQL